jgi:copper(I)-binding protein
MENDPFGKRLEARLRRLDAAIPPASPGFGTNSDGVAGRRRTSVASHIPMGVVAVAAILVVAVLSARLMGVGVGGGVGASSPSPSATGSIHVEEATGFLASTTDARLWVHLSIRNAGPDDKLIGISSSAATSGGVYAFPACTAVPSGSPCGTPVTIPWVAIRSGETVQVDGIVLSGFSARPAPGDFIPVTLHFASAPAITTEILVSEPPEVDAPSK